MKISVHLEADSAEELKAFFAAFHVKPAESPVQQQATPEPERVVRTEKEPEIEAQTTLIQDVTAEQPIDKKARKPRGPNKPKPAPVDEQPEPVAKPAPKPETPQATRDDLLNVFSEYVQRYGVSFGYTDISSLLQQHLGDGIRKASDVPEGQLLEAIDAIKAAITENPFNRKRDYA